jgi:predicted nucleic acid-binding protein
LFEGYASLVQPVTRAAIGSVILADPDDDVVLGVAVAGVGRAIVSRDAHLLETGAFRGIPIITPTAAVTRETV